MKFQQNALNSLFRRIQQQIKEIKEHVHVKSVEKMDSYTYRIQYRPFKTLSLYKERAYILLITIPKTYPNEPPTLKFLNQIYHLNVGLHSGQVRMAILQDDWSPFLSLTSLIQSLDKMLEEPDQDYSINTDVLEDYQCNRQKYFSKVLENVSDISICNTDIKELLSYSQNENSSEISPIKLNHQKIMKELMKTKHNQSKDNLLKKAKELSQNLKDSLGFEVEPDCQQKHLQMISADQKIKEFGEILKNKNCTEKNKVDMPMSQKLMDKKKDRIKMKNSESIKQPKYEKHQMKRNKTANFFCIHSQNHPNITLQRISQTMNIFIYELHHLSQLMVSCKILGIKTMLKRKYDIQLQMLKELMEISSEAKKRMIERLKDEVNKI